MMLARVNHLWRIFATGVCFAVFGIGGLVLSVIVLPIQRLLFQDVEQRKRIARQTVHYTFKVFVALMSGLGVVAFELAQAKQLKNLQGQLVLANHPTLIDVVVLISMLPNADCVVKTHLFRNFFIRGVVGNTGYISNDEPEGLLRDCQQSLSEGNNLIIFPQGTRTRVNETLSFQRGAANIAIRCQAEITAVLLSMKPSTLTKSDAWYQVPKTKPKFSAKVVDRSPRIPENNAAQTSKDVRQFNRTLENFFREELEKYE